jgi:hypothetical protein
MTIKYLDSKRISLLEADRTLYQGYDGGSGLLTGAYSGGGGGGSSSAGGNATTSASGTGGTSTNSSISGSVVAYAGGGSGGSYSNPVGAAGGAGAGLGALSASGSSSASGENATIANRGSGGGGGGWNGSSGTGAGNGSDGIVILRFTTSGNGYGQAGGTVTTDGSDTIITYTATSGTTFTPTSAFDVQYLVVAGGAGGGDRVSGGGGAGGLLTGTGFGVTAQAYTITVGAKGTGGSSNNGGSNGGNSVFSTITSIGGGAGAGWATTTGGSNGGSGGGGMDGESSRTTIGGTGTSSDVPLPTNVQDNSILVEKDTGRRYWFDADPTGTTTKTYDHYTSTGSQFDGLFTGNIIRGGIKIVSGSPAINTYIQKVKLSVKKLGSPSGNLTITVRDDSDTILASGTLANSSITTSYADYEITLDSAVKLAINYRVMGEYSGGDSSNNLIMEMQQTTIETGYENTKYNGSAYSSYGTGYRPSFTFDSTPASITLPATWTIESPPTAGLKLWLDASDSTTITKDGSNLVSAWNDKSGQLNHVTQATATNQPLWVDSVQNSKPIIRFDGTNDLLYRATYTGGTLSQDFTIFAVFKVPSSYIEYVYDGAGSSNRCYLNYHNPNAMASTIPGAPAGLDATVVAGNWTYFTSVVNGSSSILRQDGSQTDTGDMGTGAMAGITIGARYGGIDSFANTDIAEILIYNSAISGANLTDVESYLATKWGI